MELVPVDLRRNHQLGPSVVQDVDPPKSQDHPVLAHGSSDACRSQRTNEIDLRATATGASAASRFHHLLENSPTWNTSVDSLQQQLEGAYPDQATAKRALQGLLRAAGSQKPGRVYQCSRDRRHRNVPKEGDVVRFDAAAAMNDHPLLRRPPAVGNRDLDRDHVDAIQTPEMRCCSVRHDGSWSSRQERGANSLVPVRLSGSDEIDTGLHSLPESALQSALDLVVGEAGCQGLVSNDEAVLAPREPLDVFFSAHASSQPAASDSSPKASGFTNPVWVGVNAPA